MAQEITLPVKLLLANLQSIIKDMRSLLGTLKVDSSGYKKLEGVINGVEKRIQDILVIASRPIMDGKQFISIEKDVSRIYDDITKLGMEAGKIKFSDLLLTGDQKAKLQEFDNLLKTIKDDLKNIELKAKDAFLSSDAGKLWQENNPELATKSFSRITEIIELEVAKLKKAVNDAKKQYDDYQNTILVSKNINSFMHGKNSLTDKIKAAGIYDQIFNATNGNFKNGGRNALEAWLKSEFSLSDDAIKSITQGSGLQVLKAFTEMQENVRATLKSELSRLSAARKVSVETTNNGKTLTDKIASETAREQSVQATHNAVVQAIEARSQAEALLREEERLTLEARDGYVAGLVTLARAQLLMGNSCDLAKALLASLNNTVREGQAKLASLDLATNKLLGISNFVNRYVGAYAIIRKVTTAIRNAFDNIKELDKVITSIAVVTNMSLGDLWGKIGLYTLMALEYGVATKDVYTVSQIFYQQGLLTAQVMDLTTETLKMAKIAGIDYSQAANAMTVAVRAFRIEMDEALRVTDTYSALAAKFAVNSAEIANAMEKTASSAASVGMSLESTSAFISVMEQTTRESAQNIGSALKSIISRYGEMKASPDKLLNVDGEEVAFNKVDTALASIGISIKDAVGLFRDFDDVIMELAAKWGTLDNNTQRYIATIMAGNRQQSRFIALVSNYDELSRAMSVANNAENTSIVLVAKTMDSLESKTNLVKNAFSQLYLDLHIEEGLKNAYDWLTRILKTLGNLGTLKGVLPTLANIVGFGTGTKSLLKSGMDWLQLKKGKYDVETTEAQLKIDDIRTLAEKDILTKWKIHADLSDMTALKAVLEALQANAAHAAYMAYLKTGGTATELNFKDSLQRGTAKAAINLATGTDPNNKLAAMNAVDAYLNTTNSLNNLNNSISQLESALQHTANSGDLASDGLEKVGQSGTTTGLSLENLGANTNTANTAENNKATTAVQAALSNLNDAVAAREAARLEVIAAEERVSSSKNLSDTERALALDHLESAKAVLENAKANADAARKALEKALADEHGSQSEEEEIRANQRSAQSEDMKADANSKKSGLSLTDWGNGNTAKIVGVATGLARIAGTAITAIGASTLDKSTDGIERSKIWTGIGNGVSSAGMGASMGMALGPWGAAVGAIGGFLLGGLGAIIDGATMTLEELLALEKAEAKKASDEALKALAKVLDLDSSIDNIKKLLNAMYNSTEDMEAYLDAMNTMASTYPSLVSSYDAAGNAIIDLNLAEILLALTRLEASKAANSAAKAEAKTRKTTIDILTEAHNITTNLDINKNNSNYSVSHAYNEIRRFLDNAGGIHDFELSNNYWDALSTALNTANKDINNISLNELVDFITSYNGPQQYVSQLKDRFSQFTINNQTGAITGGWEYTYNNDVKDINKKLKASKDVLNLNPSDDLPSGAEYIYAFMGWKKEVELTAERIKEFDDALIQRTGNYQNIVKTLDKSLPVIDSLESLDRALLNADDYLRATKISESKFASKLIANLLEKIAQQQYLMGAGEWSRSEDEALSLAYDTAKTDATEIVISWFTSLSDDAFNLTLAAFGSMDHYLSMEDMLLTLGYTTELDFIDKSGLKQDEAKQLLASWQLSFIDSNLAARDRIIKTIYGTGENKWALNTQLGGLTKLNNNSKALDIAYKFHDIINSETGRNGQAIISEYADYFTTLLLAINDIAANGNKEIAQTRLDVLNEFANTLTSLSSLLQDAMFSILKDIDFSNYDTIQTSIKLLQEYATKNNITDIAIDSTFGPLYKALTEAAETLLFNVNTLALTLTASVTNAAKEIDSILATNKSGLSFDKALDEFANLQAQFADVKTFDSIFTYDATLLKYVYTSTGLLKSIAVREQQLTSELARLQKAADIYTKEITGQTKSGTILMRNDFTLLDSDDFKDADTLMAAMQNQNFITESTSSLVRETYNDLATKYLATEGEHTGTGFREFVRKMAQLANEDANAALLILLEFEKNKINLYFSAIDWSSLALDTDYFGTNKVMMQELAKELGLEGEQTWEQISEAYLKTIKNTKALTAARNQLNDSITLEKVSLYLTAISELLNYLANKYLSTTTQLLITQSGGIDLDIATNALTTILKARLFLKTLAILIGLPGYTLEQYNQDAKSILEAALNNGSKEKSLLDFISEDSIGADILEGLANVFGKHLDKLVDVTTGLVLGQLGQYMSYDFLAGKYNISGTFELFIKALLADFGIIILKGTKLYIEALKTWNERVINENNEIHKAVSEELNTVLGAKAGDQLNLALTFGLLGDKVNQELLNTLTNYGADFSSGILTIREGANIPAIVQELSSIAAENSLLIPEELRALTDAINAVLDTMVSNIQSGIKGSLSVSGARDLATWAKNNFKIDLDFTRTKEGLKLSTELTELLYNELVKVDSISALIVLDELNESIEESITGAKELKGVMRDVAEIRATTESDDFKFMDKSIPSGLNNPINYFNNWSEAFKKMNEAGKASGEMKNKMDYSDFYNIITEMGNLALQTGEIKLSGDTVLHNMEDAAALIEKGAAALSVAADGSIKVDLSKLGIDFSTGAQDLKANVGKGIQEVAKSQIEMLDSMIQLLETIVAMEDLGNIDVDNDSTIEINDIFPKLEYDEKGNLVEYEINQAYEDWRQNVLHQITKTINGEKNKDYNEDLAKAAKNLKIDGISFETILGWSPEQLAQLGQEFLGKYTAVMDAFWKAAKSGNYNLDNLIPSIKEVLAGTGYTGEIELGDTTLAIKNGVVLEKVDGKYKTSKGHECTDLEEAVLYEVLENTENVKDIHIDDKKQVHGTYLIENLKFDVTVNDKGKALYSIKDQTFDSLYEAVQYAYKDYTEHAEGAGIPVETYAEWSVRVLGRFVAGTVEIENLAEFLSRTHQEVQELADALSNGTDQLIVDTAAKIGIKVELTNGGLTEELRKTLSELAGVEDKTVSVTVNGDTAKKKADDILTVLTQIDDTDPNISINTDETVSATLAALENISSELSKIAAMKTLTIKITKSITTSETTTTKTTAPSADIDAITGATGTIGLAKAQGTLMGELGPELIVSNGRYFVAGLNGPEFVDLASDAIVFNHLLTEQLLKHGMSSTRGQAVTNERNAVAFASGNINGGPAMASARAALAALRQLRALWQAIVNMSAKDFAGLGGSGGGGGGGGGNDAAKDPAFVKDLEKWYNWLQRIAVLEEKINYEEAKRNKIASDMIAHGQDYAKSLLESFNYLKEQTAVHQSLADSQLVYFNLRREQMNSASNPFSALYTFDEYGQLKYKNGALALLSEIISRDLLTGKGTYTASEQYAILKNNGFERYMQYDSSGNEIDRSQEGWETNAILAFWDKIDADKEEMQSLHDSIEEHKKAVLEDQEKANDILKEIEDNLISVEDKVLKAIEDTRQREIDELLKQRDAIEESANNLINGLSELLNREKDMYSQLTSLDELTRLLRQLSILLNSGGSASQIASLLKEIGLKQLDAYFEAQLRQIDTLLLASLNELERLDRLIDLMTESLEYEKENGLLWGAVYEVMAGTPEQITSFITEHDSQYWGVSPTLLTLDTRDILFEAQLFVTYRLEMKDGITGMIDAFNSYTVETEKQLEDTRQLALDAAGANSESTTADTGGGSGGGGSSGASTSSGGKKEVSTSYIDAGSSGHKVHVAYSDGTSSEKLEAHDWDKKIITGGTKTCYCSKCNHYMGVVYPGDAHFSQGGMIDYTGPAMVHGSKSKPESVLNAEQTKILRDNILSNKPNSLINLLQAYNNGYDSNALIPATKEGVIIEQATVEMHVAQIANDYDASRAGEQALEKIMAIARKSLGSTRIGR